jgi:hypothetical protein
MTGAQQAFAECYYRIQCPSSAQRLWERHFSAEDRQRFESDLVTVYRRYRTVGMWAILRGVSLDRAVVDVGRALNFLTQPDYEWLVREIGDYPTAEEGMEAAITAGDLVLVEGPREAHWNTEEITINWNRFPTSWEFLWELCRHAKSGESIDRMTFGADAPEDIVTKRKHRLSSMPQFPISLADLIGLAGRGTQQLKLAPERIRIFQRSPTGLMVEWHP